VTDYVKLTDDQTAWKKQWGQDDFRQMRDNQESHEERITQLEEQIVFFDHFNSVGVDSGADLSFPFVVDQNGTVARRSISKNWHVHWGGADGNYGNSVANPIKPSYSVARLGVSTSGFLVDWGFAKTVPHLRFDRVTKPLRLIGRFKDSADILLIVGMREFNAGNLSAADHPGIWLERVDASNLRFVSYDTSRNNGSSFARPTAGNWYEVEIIFTDDPSDQALCYVDGVLKETLTSQLPTARTLHGAWGLDSGTAQMDCDRFRFSAAAHLDAA
jgi:hypothetical protein